MTHLKEGEKAPYFEAEDTNGKLARLSGFKGKNLVLYFYPKDDTPGCTKEACDFRDGISKIKKLNAEVVGVSPDLRESHQKFAQKYSLPFTLLVDKDNKISKEYGVYGEKSFMGKSYMGIIRSTFIINKQGIIKKIFYKVNVENHLDEVLNELMQRQIKEYVLKLSEVIDETPSVKVFRAELPEDADVDFYPGQFFMVSLVDDNELKISRAYSIASSPLNKSYLEIALNKVGIFSTKLFSLKEGALLKFKGPYGKFYFSDEIKDDVVLIGGGTGITPLMSIIRYCNDKKLANNVKLVYSTRTPDEIIYRKEIEQIRMYNKNFDFVATITRPEQEHNWSGRTGRIDLGLLKEYINNPRGSIYFLCGPKELVSSIIQMLEGLGVTKEQIKTDVWG